MLCAPFVFLRRNKINEKTQGGALKIMRIFCFFLNKPLNGMTQWGALQDMRAPFIILLTVENISIMKRLLNKFAIERQEGGRAGWKCYLQFE